ncbi:DUF3307 domain-containing protein [Klebsiella aerogenes]
MFYLAIMLVLAHLIADFYTQSKRMVGDKAGERGKKYAWCGHMTHAGEHLFAFAIALIWWFYLMGGDVCQFIKPISYLGISYVAIHLVTDVLKESFKKKFPQKDFLFFIVDQIIHFLTILVLLVVIKNLGLLQFTLSENEHVKGMASIGVIICGLLILLKPVSLFVEKFLNMAMLQTRISHIKVTKSHLSRAFEDSLKNKFDKLMDDPDCSQEKVNTAFTEYKTRAELIVRELPNIDVSIETSEAFSSNKGGQWIGYVERVMIFTFFLFGQFTAIAAIMAIKTAFRFNDLKDDNDSHRSEYIMLGTFISLFATFLISLIIKHFVSVGELAKFIDTLIKPYM